jgi:hypothetical protein
LKFLRCKICGGEAEIIDEDVLVYKKMKCHKCGFTNGNPKRKEPEIIIIKKK